MEVSRWTPIDRITEVELGKRAVGIRNVPNTLSILDSHFPRFPVLPGVLMLGSLGTLAGHLLQKQTGRPWKLVGAQQVRFRHFVRPGDQMEMTVEIKQMSDDVAVLTGTVRVEGRPVVTARQIRLAPQNAGEAS